MEFFDNALDKAKEALDIACKKTNEVVNTQKQKFDIASLENKRGKDFERLGEIYYTLIKDTDIEDTEIKTLVEEINRKNNKISELKEEVNSAKYKRICPACGASISESAVFCSSCGTKLEIKK